MSESHVFMGQTYNSCNFFINHTDIEILESLKKDAGIGGHKKFHLNSTVLAYAIISQTAKKA